MNYPTPQPPRKSQSSLNLGLIIPLTIIGLLVAMHLYRGTKFAPATDYVPSTPLDSTVKHYTGGR